MKRFVLSLFVLSLFAASAEAGIFKKLFKRRSCYGGSCYTAPAAHHPAQKSATQKATQKASPSQKSPAAQKGGSVATPPPPSAFNGESSYGRAMRLAEEGTPQTVLFVYGQRHNLEVARISAMLRAENIPVPHIVDLEECSDEMKSKAIASRDGGHGGAFLQTIHAERQGHYPYGRTWWPAQQVTSANQYASWKTSNEKPFVQTASWGGVPSNWTPLYTYRGRNGYVYTYYRYN